MISCVVDPEHHNKNTGCSHMYYLTSELYNRPMRWDTESLKNVLGHTARRSKAGIQIADCSFRL